MRRAPSTKLPGVETEVRTGKRFERRRATASLISGHNSFRVFGGRDRLNNGLKFAPRLRLVARDGIGVPQLVMRRQEARVLLYDFLHALNREGVLAVHIVNPAEGRLQNLHVRSLKSNG